MRILADGLQCLAFVLAGTLLGGFVGLVAAFGLAGLLPGYYPGVFPHAVREGIDPTQIGAGLGFSQGATLGAFVSFGVVAVLAWRAHRSGLDRAVEELAAEVTELRDRIKELAEVRSSRPAQPAAPSEQVRPPRPQP